MRKEHQGLFEVAGRHLVCRIYPGLPDARKAIGSCLRVSTHTPLLVVYIFCLRGVSCFLLLRRWSPCLPDLGFTREEKKGRSWLK